MCHAGFLGASRGRAIEVVGDSKAPPNKRVHPTRARGGGVDQDRFFGGRGG